MTVSFLDVGQGDAVLITAPNGNRLLYDAGPPDDKVSLELKNELPAIFGNVDIFIASHPDSDHIGGFISLLSSLRPLYYIDDNKINLSAQFATLENILTEKKIERYTAKDGEKIDLGSGVIINIISPLIGNTSTNNNDMSVSLLVAFGNSKILLTGDLEEKEENRIIDKYGDALSATILKAGHHGSKTSTGNNLLNTVKPKFVVISVGKNNKYGHPNASTINRIKMEGSKILETKESGTIHFECRSENCSLKK